MKKSQKRNKMSIKIDDVISTKIKGVKTSVSCDYCHRNFLKKSDLMRHVKRHKNEKDFCCEECGSSFRLKQTLDRHKQTHSKSPFTCDVCQSIYKSQKTLENHFNKLHQERTVLHANDDVVVATKFISQNIESESEISDDASTHQRVETLQNDLNQLPDDELDEKRVKQDKSPKRRDGKSYSTCSTCSKRFSKPVDLRRHIDAVHEKRKNFTCSFEGCTKSFSLKCTLQRHLVTHESSVEDRNLVVCNICHKKLSTTASLKLHQRIHDNIKPHSCQVCQMSFRTPGNLKSHSRVHSKNSIVVM